MKANGCKIKPMVQEFTPTQMELFTMDSGLMISNMGMGSNLGLMDLFIRVIINMDLNMEMEILR